MMNMETIVLTKSGLFTQDIRMWEMSTTKDWKPYKTHFKKAQMELRRHAAPISDLNLHEANALKEQVIEELYNRNVEEKSVNAMVLQDQINEVKEQLRKLNIQNKEEDTEKTVSQQRTVKNRSRRSKYFWTHGLCNHVGSACKYKKEGHVDEATVENRKNGSTVGCPWINNE